MKFFYTFLISLFFAVFPLENDPKLEVVVKEGSYLYIEGTSNVNTFTCDYLKPIQPRRLELSYKTIENGWLLKDAELSLESASFDCGGRRINSDFEELIKTNEFPSIQIKVREVKRQASRLKAKIDVSIAGSTESLPVYVDLQEETEVCYASVLRLDIEDFDLKAPTKMMGLIKVDKEIAIHFNLRLDIYPKA